ncbi:hypothetical protein ACFY36_04515 [Actinoplanes sp. NPDC000266]
MSSPPYDRATGGQADQEGGPAVFGLALGALALKRTGSSGA